MSLCSVCVVEQAWHHTKWTRLRYWGFDEHKGKNTKTQIDLPPQHLNRFVNGFVECVRGVCRYPNEPTMTPNEPQKGSEKLVSISESQNTWLSFFGAPERASIHLEGSALGNYVILGKCRGSHFKLLDLSFLRPLASLCTKRARLVFLMLLALGAGKLTMQPLYTHTMWRSLAVVCSSISATASQWTTGYVFSPKNTHPRVIGFGLAKTMMTATINRTSMQAQRQSIIDVCYLCWIG